MLQLQTLENISHETILQVFNGSFADYIVPFRLSSEQLQNKIQNDGIRPEFSAGVFEEGKLVAFILHGYDVLDNKKVLYNAGTGVLPSHRGKHLTRKLYEFIMPALQSGGIGKIQLEVITENLPAIKTYEAIGFGVTRTLNCYKGSLRAAGQVSCFDIKPLESYDWAIFKGFWDWCPSWQNSITAVENLRNQNVSIGIFEAEHLLGYLVFDPCAKRVQQFAVHKNYRFRGLGKQLFEQVAIQFGEDISIINVDDASRETDVFLRSIGLESYVTQYEMEFMIK